MEHADTLSVPSCPTLSTLRAIKDYGGNCGYFPYTVAAGKGTKEKKTLYMHVISVNPVKADSLSMQLGGGVLDVLVRSPPESPSQFLQGNVSVNYCRHQDAWGSVSSETKRGK